MMSEKGRCSMALIDYDTTQLRIPTDYGTARCSNCGGKINQLRICEECRIQWSQEDMMFRDEEYMNARTTDLQADDSSI
jgi:predicted amidophosphoribosyltransferase